MFKRIFILSIFLFTFHVAKAQKRDTAVFLMKNNGDSTIYRDSANYIRLIISPESGATLYTVHEYYLSGKLKMVGTSFNKNVQLAMMGPSVEFYPNGRRMSIINHDHNVIVGDMLFYYPNGKLYSIYRYDDNDVGFHRKLHLITCRDSTGKILAEGGNGHWIRFDPLFTKAIEEGEVKDGLEEGTWQGAPDDSVTYTCTYQKGVLVNGTSYKNGEKYHFTQKEVLPSFAGPTKFLEKNIKYPLYDKEHGIQGKVYINFKIEKDGTLSHLQIIKAPDQSLADEALRVMKLSPPWTPASYYGVPVAMPYTIPVSFSIGADNNRF